MTVIAGGLGSRLACGEQRARFDSWAKSIRCEMRRSRKIEQYAKLEAARVKLVIAMDMLRDAAQLIREVRPIGIPCQSELLRPEGAAIAAVALKVVDAMERIAK